MRSIIYLAAATFMGCSPVVTVTTKDNPLTPGVPASCRQLIVVRGSESDFHATLDVYELADSGWTLRETMLATVGKSGLATPDVKKEGDGKSPTGVYRLDRAFGYSEKIETGLTYRQATATDLWVDDPASPDYNRWVTAPTKAKSFEEMRRKDDLYEIGAVIEYNTDPVVAGKGSAIFFHVWGGPDSPTAGCVAIEKEKLRSILKWLDKTKKPHMSIRVK